MDAIFRSTDHSKFKDMLGLLKKILQNIENNPDIEKFRTIKKSNPALAARLFISPLVDQILGASGFIEFDGIFTNHSQSLDSVRDLIIMIEGFEVQLEVEENNKGVDPEQVRLRQEAIDREMAAKQAELDKLNKQIQTDRKEIQLSEKDHPITASKGKQLKFGANTKTCSDLGIGKGGGG